MDASKKVVVLPGTLQYVKNYNGYGGLDIWLGKEDRDKIVDADFMIGHSLGASFIFDTAADKQQKFILFNPLIKKRSLPLLLYRWLNFLAWEGIAWKKVVPAKFWVGSFVRVLHLLNVDVLKAIQNLPKENIVIVRGRFDKYFCTREDQTILEEKGFNIVEVDAGHDWNEAVAKAVMNIIG